MLFAKDSYILSPVTEDFLSLNYIVDNLDTDIDISNGSNIAAVLEAVSHMLSDFKVKNLIILSDGGNEKSYDRELEFAKENKISIYSVGIATKKGSPIPLKEGYMTDKTGKIVTVKLNDSIKNLSLQSGGGYIDFSLDDEDIKAIIERINSQSKKEELKSAKYKTYTELFYFPLGIGIFFFLAATSSFPGRSTFAMVFLCFYLSPYSAYGMELEFENIEKAKEYYEKKEFDKAADIYRKISSKPQTYYNLANTLYKEGKYAEAIKAYGKIVTEDQDLEYKKLHNMGNSFVKTDDLQKAKEFYEKALHIKEDKETRENLDLVNKELEKQKKQDKQDQNKKDQNKQNKDQKNNQNQNKQNSDQNKQDKKGDREKQNKQEQNKDSQTGKDKKEQNKQEKEKSSGDKDKKGQDRDQKGAATDPKELKKQPISDMEEKKWMKVLNNKKTPVYLQRMKSQKSNSNEEEPW